MTETSSTPKPKPPAKPTPAEEAQLIFNSVVTLNQINTFKKIQELEDAVDMLSWSLMFLGISVFILMILSRKGREKDKA